MDVLSPIPYVLWVHGQGLTSLGHVHCTWMPSNQAIDHASCGTTSDSWQEDMYNHQAILVMVCVVTWWKTCHGCAGPPISHILWVHGQGITSMGCCEEPHAMDMLPIIPSVLWVHGQGLTILKHSQYTGVLSIQPLGTQTVGPDLVRTAKQPCHP